jgi:tetratricopeptide (TPR) repeat protein
MRNWTGSSGVYTHMLRVSLFLVLTWAAPAQPSRQQDPLDAAIQAVWQARNTGRFDDAAAAREQARALLQRAPVDSPRFAGWVQQVAQAYQNSNRSAQARAVLQEALARTRPLGDSHPSRIAALNALGDSWRQDGNLLQAVGYLEQAAAAQAAAPPITAAAQAATRVMFVSGKFNGVFSGGTINAYIRLADLYQQLGRPDAVAAIAVKIRTLASNDQASLARFYEQHGQPEEAAAVYQKLAEQSADPQAKAGALQSLANLYASQERYTDAIASIQQAIATVQASDNPGIRSQALWIQQTLAGYMNQAGRPDQAEQVYQQLLQQSRGGPQESQMLGMYAQYLANTQRAAQGANLLQEYLGGSTVDQPQRMNALFQLANIARGTGDTRHADEYFQAAQALQPQPPPPPAGQILIGDELQKAQAAANQHRWDDAYGLALHAIAAAAQASDGQQIEWAVPQIATSLATNKETARAEQLFQRLFALAQTWKVDNMQPLIAVTQNYAHFLRSQRDRWNEVPAAIEQFRSVLIEANGPDSGKLVEPLRMKIDLERSHSNWEKAAASARDLLELQESLSGHTSEPYLTDLQTAASVYQASGDLVRALPLLRKSIAIADLLDTPNNAWRRSQTRMDTALALARLGQFDEAETLGEEAVALNQTMRTPRPPLAQELEQIRRMKQAAQAAERY